jgi:opacity protein-like surface antigen
MRKKLLFAIVACGLACVVSASAARAATHRIGAGANYWKTLNNIDSNDLKGNIDESGLSWLASYQYVPEGIFKLEVDLEYYPSLGEERKAFWSPEAFVLVGGTVYAGVGIGDYFDGSIFSNKPFFMLRAGVDFAILPFLTLDINANYRFNNWDTLQADDVDTNTIRLGAALRFGM